MRKGRHGLIDLVVLSLDSAYILEIIRGVEEALSDRAPARDLGDERRGPTRAPVLAKISDGWTDGAILVLAQGQSARVQSYAGAGLRSWWSITG